MLLLLIKHIHFKFTKKMFWEWFRNKFTAYNMHTALPTSKLSTFQILTPCIYFVSLRNVKTNNLLWGAHFYLEYDVPTVLKITLQITRYIILIEKLFINKALFMTWRSFHELNLSQKESFIFSGNRRKYKSIS